MSELEDVLRAGQALLEALTALDISRPYQDEEKPYYMFSEEDAERIRAALELAEKAGMMTS